MIVVIISIVCAIISASTDAITLLMYAYAFSLYMHKIRNIERNLERIASQSEKESLHVSSRHSDNIVHHSSSRSDSVEIEII